MAAAASSIRNTSSNGAAACTSGAWSSPSTFRRVAELTIADTEVDPTEISPLELAQIHFARAQALVKASSDVALAKKLAQDALDLYRQHAPDTQKFRDERDAIQTWLASVP